jgi:hypothetical protein
MYIMFRLAEFARRDRREFWRYALKSKRVIFESLAPGGSQKLPPPTWLRSATALKADRRML